MNNFSLDSLNELKESLKDFKNEKFLYAITCRLDYWGEVADEFVEIESLGLVDLFGVKVYILEDQKDPFKLFYNQKDLNEYLINYGRHQ